MTPEDRIGRVVAECLFRSLTSTLTRLLNILGTADTVELLRKTADDLEAAAPALEAARERRPKVQA